MRSVGAGGARSLEEIRDKLAAPRVAWVMVPSGEPTEETIKDLADVLETGDIIIDGGNSNYKDSVRRAAMLKDKELHFVDVGTSGGIWGLEVGYCMMIGGPEEAFRRLEPALATLAPADGYLRVGPSGAVPP